ncbi:MAG: SGNH/GDSL hydrolase family protein [Patescibacteria group bacterium]
MKKLAFSAFPWFLILVFLTVIYRNWFIKGLLSAPDFSYIFPMQLADFQWFPFAWSNLFNSGLGGTTFNTLNLDTYLHLGVKFFVYTIHLPWHITYRILFFWPFIILSVVSSYLLSFSLFRRPIFSVVASLIYTTNTYVLMLAGGGQIGLMMAYSVAPVVLFAFINTSSVTFGFALAALLLFDLRYSFLMGALLFLYWLFVLSYEEKMAKLRHFFLPVLIVLGVHSFWLIPGVFAKGLSLPEGYGNTEWLHFLSWAEFSKSISMLHPNWPENIFGKTYFFEAKFLSIPIISFASLLFMNGVSVLKQKQIIFFVTASLIGAFFAKGTNPPFSHINQYFFERVPFFDGFRDPTKFYLLTVISFSLLIPFSLSNIADFMKSRFRHISHGVLRTGIFLIFFAGWFILIAPIFRDVRTGTFADINIPDEYRRFADMIYADRSFGRIVVFPWRNRFIFQSELHPATNARDILHTSDLNKMIELAEDSDFSTLLARFAIRYVVIPDDFTNEIFLTNRVQDPNLKISFIKTLDSLKYLKRLNEYKNLIVYEFIPESGLIYTAHQDNTYEYYNNYNDNAIYYKVDITNGKRPLLIHFSQRYDPNWKMWDGVSIITSSPSAEGLNTFLLNADVTSQVVIYNAAQRILEIGYAVSAVVILLVILLLWIRFAKSKKINRIFYTLIAYLILAIFISAFPKSTFINLFVSTYDQLQRNFYEVIRSNLNKIYIDEGKTSLLQSLRCAHEETLFVSNELSKMDCFAANKKSNDVIYNRCWIEMWSCYLIYGNLKAYTGARSSNTKIGILGDSISAIYGKLNYSYLLSYRFGFIHTNSSIPGSTVSYVDMSESAFSRYDAYMRTENPNIILVFLGTNDLTAKVTPEIFRQNYSRLIYNIKILRPNAQIIAIGLLRRKDHNGEMIKNYRAIIKATAIHNKINFIDPYNWLSEGDMPDGLHPSIESQKKLASGFYHSMQAFIR